MPAYQFSLDSAYIDNRGVTDETRFKEHYEKTRQNLSGKDLVIYCAEHCFCPEQQYHLFQEYRTDLLL